jgi:2'-hydroxyisoflavone reductase
MKLLILGGTKFLGRHIAEMALARGDEVTLLHRGQTGATLFPQARHLLADRNTGLAQALADAGTMQWDAAIDTSAYFPRQARLAAEALSDRVGRYVFISSISVYSDMSAPSTDESAATAVLPDPSVEAITGETYGGLKRLCEQAAEQAFGSRCLIARPGLIVGPFDPTGRFTWWLQRIAQAGVVGSERSQDVLAPGLPSAPVQFIDARDLAAWLLSNVDAQHSGIFNLTGPSAALTMGEYLQSCCDVLNPGARLCWADENWLLEEGVKPWSELPVWLPVADAGLHRASIAKAVATGLHTRPLPQTVADTAAWAGTVMLPSTGISAAREAELFSRFRAAHH